MASYNGDLTDGVTVADVEVPNTVFLDGYSDFGLVVGRYPDPFDMTWVFSLDATDTAQVTSVPGVIKAVTAALTDGADLTSASTPAWAVQVKELLDLLDAPGPQTTFNVLFSDVGEIRERVKAGYGLTVSETATLAAAAVAQTAYTLSDGVSVEGAVTPAGVYHLAQSEQARVADLLIRLLGGDIAETINLSDTMGGIGLFSQMLTDTTEIADAVAGPLILQVVAEDDMEITAADAVQMLYEDHLSDAVSLTALYLSPSGSVTTWALNTKNSALTEYADYAFNSFGQVGGRYVGASESGLYELAGDTDAGTDIIGRIKTGFAQMAGSRFTSFRAAYLAVRGGGEFVLKLEDGSGKTYHYTVRANDMETTKIRLGKGLRARYFSFELISTGQDFDLESLEFVPIMAKRRV